MLLLEEITKDKFIYRFSNIYEKSQWVAEEAWVQVSKKKRLACADLYQIMSTIVEHATYDSKLTLLRSHPSLGTTFSIQDEVTQNSLNEQESAGLTQCSEQQYKDLETLNSLYREKFGFPFILAVKGWTVAEIIEIFQSRLKRSKNDEFVEAMKQVQKIASFRIDAVFQ